MMTKLTDGHVRALALLTQRRFADAAAMFDELIGDGAASTDVLNDAAVACYHAGRANDALALLDDALRRDATHPFARINQFYFRRADEHRRKLSSITFRPRRPGDPRVSIVMPTYNRPYIIRESIESVLAQTFTDFELVIINDGGLRSVEQTLAAYDDARIRYHYAEHGGLSHALNVGLSRARGAFIAYLDDDDIYYPNHLATMMAHFDAHPDSDVAYSDVNRVDLEDVDGAVQPVAVVPKRAPDFDADLYVAQNYTPVLSIVHRYECMEMTGPFNTSIKFGMDWDAWIRMSRQYVFTHVPVLTGEFRWRTDGMNMSTAREYSQEYFNNVILWMYGGLMLTTDFLDHFSPREREYAAAGLRTVIESDEFLAALPLRALRTTSRAYRFFYALGKEFLALRHPRLAAVAFRAARRTAPFEPKLYSYHLRAILAAWTHRGSATDESPT